MPEIQPFELYSDIYDDWFVRNKNVYELELKAVKLLLPEKGNGLEIGVGSGKFALPLGIKTGVEPAKAMADKARELGIKVIEGVAEELPFGDEEFEFVLFVTTICFVDDIEKSFKEARRVLKKTGSVIVGFVDRNSEMGKKYLAKKKKSRFYSSAIFYAAEEILERLSKTGFNDFKVVQTVLPENEKETLENGFGKGSFVVIRGEKNKL